ncbi:peptide deformylase [Nakamurella endophytica]|uniref:Peptide deformylase n=1 Tax=Nakamurella endophytica TaxID=1748367 RepID=A0A917TC30_9ACTN|nr:peptide deformylase [Nakamurella endophytica]GGM17736.1 peptide deformylase 1 [Nakamurella endophytica]
MNALETRVRELLSGPRPLPIVRAGDPVLRRPADRYDGGLPDEVWAELLAAMRESMLAAPGVGLAAPQIGLGIAVAVVEDAAGVPAEVASVRERVPVPYRVIVNPRYEAVDPGDTATFYEGCLSVPGYQAAVTRPRRVRLRATDEHGRAVDEEVTGWAARIVAHETDHLGGVLYLDRAETRSLAATEQYLARWAGEPAPDRSRAALGW